MPPKASASAQAEVPEDEIDEEFPEDQEPEPAASTRKPRVLKKPNERKKFKGTGWRVIFYSMTLRRVKDTRLANGKITGTAAKGMTDIGGVAKSVRFDSDGRWKLQAYQAAVAGTAANPINTVITTGQVTPNSAGYQSFKVVPA